MTELPLREPKFTSCNLTFNFSVVDTLQRTSSRLSFFRQFLRETNSRYMFSLANCVPKEAPGQVMERHLGGSSLSFSSIRDEEEKEPATAAATAAPGLSRYESQKRRDWNTFGQYLKNHKPPLALPRCSGAHVLEFLRYLDQFGKTKVHNTTCPFFGHLMPPAPCPCPFRQAWGSLDALVGRLRAAFEENGGQPEANPFGARAVRLYLREVREQQAKARGIAYEKKKRKLPTSTKPSSITFASSPRPPATTSISSSSSLTGMHQSQSYHHNHFQVGKTPVSGEEAAFGGSTIPLSVLN